MLSLKKSQQGLGFVEILITIVLVSIGILGVAGLHMTSLKHSQNSYMQTVAMLQAYDMADRIRANSEGAYQGAYNNITSAPDDPQCISTACDSEELAEYDAFDWNSDNAYLLPLGAGTVTGNSTEFTITVRWDGNRRGATGLDCDPDDDDDLVCYQLTVKI